MNAESVDGGCCVMCLKKEKQLKNSRKFNILMKCSVN